MRLSIVVLVALLAIACTASPQSSATVDKKASNSGVGQINTNEWNAKRLPKTPPSVIVELHKEPGPSAWVAGTYVAKMRLWKRVNGTCYLAVDVSDWEPIFLDITGSVCDDAPDRFATTVDHQKRVGGER